MPNVVDTRGPPALEAQARHLRMHLHLQVSAPHRRAQEGARRRHAAAALGGELVQPHALLLRAVEVGIEGEARRFARGNEVAAQRMRVVADVGDVQRPAPSAIGGIARGIILDRLVGGQHLVEAPAGIAGALPVLVVLGMAADIDHGIDRGGAAQDLAARIVVALPVEAGIGLGLVHPVDAGVVEGLAIAQGHLHEEAAVAAARLQHQHAVAPVRREPLGQYAAGRTGAHDDEIELHGFPPPGESGSLCSDRSVGNKGVPLTRG